MLDVLNDFNERNILNIFLNEQNIHESIISSLVHYYFKYYYNRFHRISLCSGFSPGLRKEQE